VKATVLGRARSLGLLLSVLLIAALTLRYYGLSFNITDSMPIGLYHVDRRLQPVLRGAIVQACLPPAIAVIGRRRGYLAGGSCPDGSASVLKIVAAAGGDRLQLSDRRILVNGHPLPGSGTARDDARGRPLERVARGTFTLARGELWFWTPNPSSWDSRYYGPVPEGRVLGRATLLFSFGAWNFANAKG
jgi:conjugative transfer signal peptidase TraF